MQKLIYTARQNNPILKNWTLYLLMIYCIIAIGCASKEIQITLQSTEPAAALLLTPAETVTSGEPVELNVVGYDMNGMQTGTIGAIEWQLAGLSGTIENNIFTPAEGTHAHAGTVTAKSGELTATARIRIIPDLPWTEDFENIELETAPSHWISAKGKYFVREVDGNKVLVKTPVQRGLDKSNVYIGPPTMDNYHIQVDIMGTRDKRRMPDMGLIANRYTLDMQGRQQRLQIRSWASDLRMAKTIDFEWEADVWYTMKMKVDIIDEKAIIRGKVWQRDKDEPEEWTIQAEDPLPNREGSPGIYAYSVTEIYYDNLKVW